MILLASYGQNTGNVKKERHLKLLTIIFESKTKLQERQTLCFLEFVLKNWGECALRSRG